MLGKLTIGQKIAGIMTAGAIGVLGLSATLNIIETQALIRGSIDTALKDAEKGFTAKIEDESVRAVTAAALVASNTVVRTAMAQQDRAFLQNEWVPRFAELKDKFAVRQMQFHTPESKSFLRIHRPDRFGDDLSAIRPGVVAANAERKAVSGLEMGREGLGLRGIAPINHEGRHVGTVEFGLSFDETLFKDFQQQFGVKVALYIDQDGKLELFAGSAPDFKELGADLLARGAQERVLIERLQLGGLAHAAVAHPVLDFAGRPIGVGVKAIDRTAYDAALARTWQVAGGLAAIVAFFAAGIVWVMNRHIGRPLSTMTGVMQAMATGALDTALDCGRRQDEIGKMACVLEEFRTALKRTREMEREQAELQSRMEAERRTALLEVANGFESSVRGVVQSLEVSVGTMQAASTQMSAAAGQTKAQSEAVSRSSEETNSNVQTVAAAAEEMSVSIQEIARQAVAARDATTQAVTSVRDADATVSRLEQAAASINEIVTAISDIANKTNPLALNATIEAARAGEAGKGFAVVASEVKALAMQTKRATEEIGGKIGMMRDATHETSRAVGSVKGVIQSVDGIASAIAAAAEQQSAATNEIVRSVQSAAHGIQTVTENISGVRECANDSSRTAEEVHSTATGLADNAATLSQRVEAFLKQLRAA